MNVYGSSIYIWLENMAVVVFRCSALFHVILLFLTFSCASCHLYDAYILNVSRTDGFTSIISKFNVPFEYCAVSHNVNSSLVDLPLSLLWSRPPGTVPFKLRSHLSIQSVAVSILLLSGDIESNPGPATPTVPSTHHVSGLNVGCINAYSAVNKVALLHNAIDECKLDILVVTETWN